MFQYKYHLGRSLLWGESLSKLRAKLHLFIKKNYVLIHVLSVKEMKQYCSKCNTVMKDSIILLKDDNGCVRAISSFKWELGLGKST